MFYSLVVNTNVLVEMFMCKSIALGSRNGMETLENNEFAWLSCVMVFV